MSAEQSGAAQLPAFAVLAGVVPSAAETRSGPRGGAPGGDSFAASLDAAGDALRPGLEEADNTQDAARINEPIGLAALPPSTAPRAEKIAATASAGLQTLPLSGPYSPDAETLPDVSLDPIHDLGSGEAQRLPGAAAHAAALGFASSASAGATLQHGAPAARTGPITPGSSSAVGGTPALTPPVPVSAAVSSPTSDPLAAIAATAAAPAEAQRAALPVSNILQRPAAGQLPLQPTGIADLATGAPRLRALESSALLTGSAIVRTGSSVPRTSAAPTEIAASYLHGLSGLTGALAGNELGNTGVFAGSQPSYGVFGGALSTAGQGYLPMATAPGLLPEFGRAGWEQALGSRLLQLSLKGEQHAQIALNPPQLGHLKVALSIDSEYASVQFASLSPQVREALEAALPRFREIFQQSGLELVNVDVNDGGGANEQGASPHRSAALPLHDLPPDESSSDGPPELRRTTAIGLIDAYV
ncbi:MAG: flagellar hook-length control protein FliK [Pseudomonadota bacterium]